MQKATSPNGAGTKPKPETDARMQKRELVLQEITLSIKTLDQLRVQMHRTMREGPDDLSMQFHNVLNFIEYCIMKLEDIMAEVNKRG
jgi:hypothetical protein